MFMLSAYQSVLESSSLSGHFKETLAFFFLSGVLVICLVLILAFAFGGSPSKAVLPVLGAISICAILFWASSPKGLSPESVATLQRWKEEEATKRIKYAPLERHKVVSVKPVHVQNTDTQSNIRSLQVIYINERGKKELAIGDFQVTGVPSRMDSTPYLEFYRSEKNKRLGIRRGIYFPVLYLPDSYDIQPVPQA